MSGLWASSSSTKLTAMRVPRTTGLPPRIRGSAVMRSSYGVRGFGASFIATNDITRAPQEISRSKKPEARTYENSTCLRRVKKGKGARKGGASYNQKCFQTSRGFVTVVNAAVRSDIASSIRRVVGFSSRDGQPRHVKIVPAGGVGAGDPRIVVRGRLGLFVVRHALQDLARLGKGQIA